MPAKSARGLELAIAAGDELGMNFVPKSLVLALALSALTGMTFSKSIAERRPLRANSIRFVYREFEGERNIACKHALVSEASPYDFKVSCYEGAEKFAEYVAHIALSQYALAGPTKYSVELLYWLTGSRLPSEVGSTTWFHFAEKGDLRGISTSQTVENGQAGLYLEIGPEAIRLSGRTR
jgi:hypothetical protein